MKNCFFLFSVIVLLASCGGENTNYANNHFLHKDSPIKGHNYDVLLDGASLPTILSLDTTSLLLNGGGVRVKFRLKVYVAGLYLTNKNSDPEEIINEDKPQAIRLHMTSVLMTNKNMSRYIIEGFERATDGNVEPFQEQIDLAVAIFNEAPINKNDIYDMFYLPEENGIKAYKNGKFIGFVTGGFEFKKAMFGIWLSDDPVDLELKNGILGL